MICPYEAFTSLLHILFVPESNLLWPVVLFCEDRYPVSVMPYGSNTSSLSTSISAHSGPSLLISGAERRSKITLMPLHTSQTYDRGQFRYVGRQTIPKSSLIVFLPSSAALLGSAERKINPRRTCWPFEVGCPPMSRKFAIPEMFTKGGEGRLDVVVYAIVTNEGLPRAKVHWL